MEAMHIKTALLRLHLYANELLLTAVAIRFRPEFVVSSVFASIVFPWSCQYLEFDLILAAIGKGLTDEFFGGPITVEVLEVREALTRLQT
jgi:hypothetical protein